MNTINTTEKTGLQTRIEHKVNIYEQITGRICMMLEAGAAPWHKTWDVKRGFPRNLVSGKIYRGINVWLLHSLNYESPLFLTYKQAVELGGNVKKGQKSCPVVFYRKFEIEDEQTGDKKNIPMLRYYWLFNVSQCENIKDTPAPVEQVASTPAEIVAGMPNRPNIKGGMAAAFYSPVADEVGMPEVARFANESDYYATLDHELSHSTGHSSRLNRQTLQAKQGFGSDPYAREELIAELSASYLCGVAGIVDRTIDNSAAYLQGWISALKNDRKLIVTASAQAQRAADYVLGFKTEQAAE